MAWTIDNSHSQLTFTVKHLMIANVRGNFGSFEGTVDFNENDVTQSKVEGSVDVASIDTREKQRDAHLLSGDFFDIENHPTMTFTSTRIEAAGGDKYRVTGDLTIRGTTKEVTFDVTDEGGIRDPWGNDRRAFSADTEINRKEFGLNWNVALEAGGVLVGDKVKFHAEVELVKSQEDAAETVAGEAAAVQS